MRWAIVVWPSLQKLKHLSRRAAVELSHCSGVQIELQNCQHFNLTGSINCSLINASDWTYSARPNERLYHLKMYFIHDYDHAHADAISSFYETFKMLY